MQSIADFKSIGEWLKARMKDRDETVAIQAETLGVTQSKLYEYANCERCIPEKHIEAFARYYKSNKEVLTKLWTYTCALYFQPLKQIDEEIIGKTLGGYLYLARNNKKTSSGQTKISATKICKVLKISSPTLQKIEKNASVPDDDTIEILGLLCGFDKNEVKGLLQGTEARKYIAEKILEQKPELADLLIFGDSNLADTRSAQDNEATVDAADTQNEVCSEISNVREAIAIQAHQDWVNSQDDFKLIINKVYKTAHACSLFASRSEDKRNQSAMIIRMVETVLAVYLLHARGQYEALTKIDSENNQRDKLSELLCREVVLLTTYLDALKIQDEFNMVSTECFENFLSLTHEAVKTMASAIYRSDVTIENALCDAQTAERTLNLINESHFNNGSDAILATQIAILDNFGDHIEE